MARSKNFDKNDVLERAMFTFWKNGFHATSMNDLVNAMEINRSSIYDTFGGKQEIFDAAFRNYIRSNTEIIKTFFSDQSTIKEGFRNLFKRAIAQSIKDKDRKGCFVVNTTAEFDPTDEKMLNLLNENRTSFETLFEELLETAVEKGEIDDGADISVMSKMLFAFYNGQMILSKISSNLDEHLPAIDLALSVLDRPIKK